MKTLAFHTNKRASFAMKTLFYFMAYRSHFYRNANMRLCIFFNLSPISDLNKRSLSTTFFKTHFYHEQQNN